MQNLIAFIVSSVTSLGYKSNNWKNEDVNFYLSKNKINK